MGLHSPVYTHGTAGILVMRMIMSLKCSLTKDLLMCIENETRKKVDPGIKNKYNNEYRTNKALLENLKKKSIYIIKCSAFLLFFSTMDTPHYNNMPMHYAVIFKAVKIVVFR